jgi:aminoglycoside 3-N-acetyltransferase I
MGKYLRNLLFSPYIQYKLFFDVHVSNETYLIRRLGKEDMLLARQLIRLFKEVFEMEEEIEVSEPNLIRLLENPAFVAYAAMLKNKIVGGLTAYELPMYYAQGSEMFIYDIAVAPDYQRKGIGKKLLSELNDYCRQKGIAEVFVAANEEDTHALDFYRATGGAAEKVVHFTYFTAENNPGQAE